MKASVKSSATITFRFVSKFTEEKTKTSPTYTGMVNAPSGSVDTDLLEEILATLIDQQLKNI
jgi:hypothetical protein